MAEEVVRVVRVTGRTDGMDTVAAALEKVAAGYGKLNQATEATERLDPTKQYQAWQRSLDPVGRSMQTLERNINTVTRAFETGRISPQQYTKDLAALERQLNSLGTTAQREQRSLESVVNRVLPQTQAQQGQRAADQQARQDALDTARYQQERQEFGRSFRERVGVEQPAATQMGATYSALAEQARRQDELARSANALRASVNPVGHAFDILGQEVAHVNELMTAGLLTQEEYTRGLAMAQSKFANVQRNYGGDQAANTSKLAATQFTNLGYQLNDVISGLMSGQSPLTILTQQGGQVYQALASAQGGVVGGLSAVKASLMGLLTPAVGVMGGVSAAALTAAASYSRLSSSIRDVNLAISGAGRASGTTAGQIDRIAQGTAGGGVSVNSARAMAAEFASTGRIGQEMYAGLIRVTKDFATVTGTDLSTAQKTLAEAFADPAKGAETLQKVLGGLDDATAQNIIQLQAQGDRLGAQRMLLDAFAGTIKTAGENVSFMSKAWDTAAAGVSNFFERVGRGAANAFQGGSTIEEQLDTAMKVLENSKARAGMSVYALLPWAQGDVDRAEAEVARLRKVLDDQAKASDQAAKAQRGQEVGGIVRGVNSDQQRLRALEQQAENIRTGLKDLPLDEQGRAQRTMDTLLARAAQLKQDMAAGGAAFADALRNAQFSARTLGFSPGAQSAQEIEQKAEAARRAATAETDASRREDALRTVEQTRQLELETARRASLAQSSSQGGAFSQASPALQQQFIAAEIVSGINREIIAAVAQRESSLNPNVGYSKSLGSDGRPSSAYGLGQITRGAEQDVRTLSPGFDRTDPAQMATGIGLYLKFLKDQLGDETKAIAAYNQGAGNANSPAALQYAADIRRRAGMAGDASATGIASTLDENARAVRTQNELVELNSRLLGVNGQQLDAQSRARELLSAAEAKGIPITAELRAALEQTASGFASAAQRMKMVQFSNDINFERDQLGRNAQDQAIYSRVRSQFGDTTSDAARTAIEMAKANDNLKITKDLTTGMFQGIGQDLLNGAKAADAFHNAFNRMASKLLDMSIDNIMSNLFKGMMGGQSGGGGLFSGLLGSVGNGASGGTAGSSIFSGVSWSANGNIMTSRGPVPLNRYANGGIANSPQFSIFGEGRTPEAYVPLPDGRSIPVSMRVPNMPAPSASNGSGPMQVNIHNAPPGTSARQKDGPNGPSLEVIVGNIVDNHLTSASTNKRVRQAFGVNPMNGLR